MSDERCDLLCLDLPRAEALRARLVDEQRASELAARAAALGDPTRLTLASVLADGGELCVCDLGWIHGGGVGGGRQGWRPGAAHRPAPPRGRVAAPPGDGTPPPRRQDGAVLAH